MKLLDLTDKTIAQLVRETGISRSTLVDIIKGNTEFKSTSVENGMKISEALNSNIPFIIFPPSNYKFYYIIPL